MVHSHESRTGQQQRVLQGDTLALANVGQSLLSSAQARIVRGADPLAMGVASDRRLMGTIEHHTRYPTCGSTEVLRGSPHILAALAACDAEAWRIWSLWAD